MIIFFALRFGRNFTDSCLLSFWFILIHRTSSSMEDTTAMTIEFLRARLLSERSVSRSARQRAEELAKRVCFDSLSSRGVGGCLVQGLYSLVSPLELLLNQNLFKN